MDLTTILERSVGQTTNVIELTKKLDEFIKHEREEIDVCYAKCDPSVHDTAPDWDNRPDYNEEISEEVETDIFAEELQNPQEDQL
jgi:hypothetical protein